MSLTCLLTDLYFDFVIFRFSIELDKSRELEIGIYWKDWRSLCAVKFLRLEEFIDDVRHGMALQLEPQGLLFAEIKFLNPMISRKPKLQRQRKIFKQQVKNFPRANQMNINVATWGRLLKRSAPSLHNSRNSESPPSGEIEFLARVNFAHDEYLTRSRFQGRNRCNLYSIPQ